MSIDVRTLVLVLGITHTLQVIIFFHQFKVNRAYEGIGWWLLWSIAAALGFGCILLRDIPSLLPFAIIGQNSLIVLGTIFINVGVMRFLGKKEDRRILIPLFAIFVLALVYFVFVNESMSIRSVVINTVLAVISFLTAWGLFVYKFRSIAASANFNAAIFVVHGCVFVYRTVMIATGTPIIDFFSPTLFNQLAFLDALIVSLLWTFGFIMMLNQRLNAEMTESKEHFELIFSTGPDAALITRLEDGVIVEVSEGFTALTGFTREESLGRSSLELHLWKSLEARQELTARLKERGSCENYEAMFQRKDGSLITGLMSAKIITLNGNPHIISVTRDVSERKRVENEREQLIRELNSAMENIKTLQGLIPICSNCKKIRDDKGSWNQLEAYFHEHTDATFTHGMCPDCADKMYGELYRRKGSREAP